MASIIERRSSLHKRLDEQQQENRELKSINAQLQGLANVGTISYMIAHEINNLLTPLGNYASIALQNPDDKELTEKALQKTVISSERARKIMESMLSIADGKTQEKKQSQLTTLVEEVFMCLCRDFSRDGITVEICVPEDLKVWAVPVQFQQVLMNLILNARDSMLPRGGILKITAEDNIDSVRIAVSDTGCGIKAGDLANIFETFFTTKTDRTGPFQQAGAGLGLAFCKKIIETHGGCISVESEPSIGSTFIITLPKLQ